MYDGVDAPSCVRKLVVETSFAIVSNKEAIIAGGNSFVLRK